MTHDFDLLYSNVLVRRVSQDPVTGTLTISVVYAGREEQKMLYGDVLYSQIDNSTEGERIVLAVELMPDEYCGEKHQSSIARFISECKLQNLDSLKEMIRRGYRLFSHYIGERDECIVIAKSLSIC